MKNDFIVYVDFDRTLYDSKLFSEDMWKLIARRAGVPASKVKVDSVNHFSHPGLGGYGYETHITSYGLDPDEMWHELDRLIAQKHYLFDDSIEFIQSLRAKGLDPKILSFGESRFQLAKIDAMVPLLTGREHSRDIEVIVVDRKKAEHIYDLHQGQRGVLVDDKPDQQLHAGFTEIHINRDSRLAQPVINGDVVVVSDLHQARQVIESLSSQ